MASTAAQLASLQTLIANIEAAGVAGYVQNGQTLTFQDLRTLYARESELQARLRSETGTSFSLAQQINE